MSEKASIFQTVQVGIETTPGTPVAASKKLLACSIVPSVKVEAEPFRAAGNKYSSLVSLNKEWTEAKLEGRLTYNEILYLLSSLLSKPTPTLQGTGTYKWVFSSDTAGEDAGKSLTVEQGDATTAWRSAGVRVAGLKFSFSRNEITMDGDAVGEPLETGITLTASPTSMTPRVVLPTQLSLVMEDKQADLATGTPITRGFSLEWSLLNKIGLVWPIGGDPFTVETEPTLEAVLKLATDSVGMGLLTKMRTGSTKWFRLEAEGATIESTYKYTFRIDFPGIISDVGEFSDEDGVYLIEYTLTGVHDATWAKAFEITVINDVAAADL